MAFGKDTSARAAAGSFRQSSAKFTQNTRGKGGGKGGVPYFIDMFTPSTTTLGRMLMFSFMDSLTNSLLTHR